MVKKVNCISLFIEISIGFFIFKKRKGFKIFKKGVAIYEN